MTGTSRDWRTTVGTVSVCCSVACFALGSAALGLILSANAKTSWDWMFTSHPWLPIRMVVSAAMTSIVTLISSCFARDKKRAVGITFSVVNLLLFGSLLGGA